jgi:hypothetical protein
MPIITGMVGFLLERRYFSPFWGETREKYLSTRGEITEHWEMGRNSQTCLL